MSIKETALAQKNYVIEQRRFFHRNPELAYKEFETTKHIAEELKAMGIETRTFDDMTGVVGTLRGGKPGPVVLLRADMDALPVAEETGLPYASDNGCMHACGHDGHMAGLLGAAKILAGMREELCGTVRFAFEPAEESPYGGPGGKDVYGSFSLIDKGVLDGVSAAFALHLWAGLDKGKISVERGVRMAANDYFSFRVHGESTHGATPQNGHDAVVAACAAVMNLQTIASRVNDPRNMFVLTVGKMTGGTIFNTVANEAELEGTVRTFSKEFRDRTPGEIEKIVRGTCEGLGCTCDFIYNKNCSVMDNDDEELNAVAAEAAADIYGTENVIHMDAVTASESFTAYMDLVPAHFAHVGVRDEENGMVYANHHTKFVIDEDTLYMAGAYLAECAKRFLEEHA